MKILEKKKDYSFDFSDIEKIPCHMQEVERAIKDGTEAYAGVYGEERRDEYIKTKRHARILQQSYESKKDFFLIDVMLHSFIIMIFILCYMIFLY